MRRSVPFFLLLFSVSAAYSQCLNITVSTSSVSCHGGNDGQVTINVLDGVGPFTYDLYLWAPGVGGSRVGSISSAATTFVFEKSNLLPAWQAHGIPATTALPPGTEYRVEVSASGGGGPFCEIRNVNGLVISEPPALTISVDAVDSDCNPLTGGANAEGSITLGLAGGVEPYDITWPTATTPIAPRSGVLAGPALFDNLDGGSYSVLIEDAHGCTFTTNIDVPISTLPDAGPDQAVCGQVATLSANPVGPGEVGTWSGPAGLVFNPSANAPNAIVSNLPVGSTTITWTITDLAGTCAGNGDDVIITSHPPATVDAGLPQEICAGSTVTLAGVVGGSATSGTWTTSGDGSFSSAADLNAVYTPGANDIAVGTVELTLTTDDPAGPCVAVDDAVEITITSGPTVSAGDDQEVCEGESVSLSGTFSSPATSALWSTSGDGAFGDPTDLSTDYTPGPNDISGGSVILTLTTDDPPGACVASDDAMTVVIRPAATVDAGAPQTVCAESVVNLSGTFGGGATSVTWSTAGDGTFSDASSATAVYTPGPGDITAGGITLTLTTNDPAGPCGVATDNVLITLDPVATVDVGEDQTICSGTTLMLAAVIGGSASAGTWTTSGDGTFDDPSKPDAEYTPGATDVVNGTFILTFTTDDPAGTCGPVQDALVVTLNPIPTVDAGGPQTICAGGPVSLTGTIGGAATSAVWSTSGDGSFGDASSLSTEYIPGANDMAAGTVTLTLTTNDPAGPCLAVNDNAIITIEPAATVDAGPDLLACQGSPVTLAGNYGGAATSATWSSAGDGSFDDPAKLDAVYTPGLGDISSGVVTLTFTTDDPVGLCPAVQDEVIITLEEPATVSAGPDQAICMGMTATLAGTFGGAASAVTWTSAGDGNFDDDTKIDAVYTPGPNDLANGSVILTLTTDDPAGSCSAAQSTMLLTFEPGATADAGPDQTICAGSTVSLSATFGGTATSGTWSSSGDGTFDNPAMTNAVYTPGPNDLTGGGAVLTFTTDDPAGACPAVSDELILTIDELPVVDAGVNQLICAGSDVTLAGAITGSVTSGVWSTSGDGTFSDATLLTAVYIPGVNDLATGTVTLTLTSDDPAGPCGTVADVTEITFETAPTVDAGTAQTICVSGTATLTGAAIGGSATTGEWSIVAQPAGGDGIFSDENPTVDPAAVTFTATVAGDYTLRLTTDDPAGACVPVHADVVITVTAGPVADAGVDQTICAGETLQLAGSYSGTTGILWSTSGDGSFDDAAQGDAIYTPGPNDIANQAVTLTMTTAGPCAPVSDDLVVTIAPVPTVDAGPPTATVCSDAALVLNGSFGGSATGLIWTTSGDGTFSDAEDEFASYAPGSADVANGSVTLTATATGSCPGYTDVIAVTINPGAVVDAGDAQSICEGNSVILAAVLGGSATSVTWTSSGDGAFDDDTKLDAEYTPGVADIANGTVVLTATTNNPPGVCPSANDVVVITISPISGDPNFIDTDTWIGHVYDDSGDPRAFPARIDFDATKYRGYVEAADIANMNGSAVYDAATGAFDLNLGLNDPLHGPNVCGTYLNNFSVRYVMNKTFTEGIFRFTVGGDDGVRLLVDGVEVTPAESFNLHSYTEYTTEPVCLGAGVHELELQYFDNTAQSRVSFGYELVPEVQVAPQVEVCKDSPAPTLSASSPDAGVVDYSWYFNGALVHSGADYTPGAGELDMVIAGTTTFEVAAVYACGESPRAVTVVEVLEQATLMLSNQTVCASAGMVDLTTLVSATPGGGTFSFAGPGVTGTDFDPTGRAGETIDVVVDYVIGTCAAPQGTLQITVTDEATITVPASPVALCESAGAIDLSALIAANPGGGVLNFSSPYVTGNDFNPAGLAGIYTVGVSYTAGGCAAPPATFDIEVVSTATLTITDASVCENGSPLNLETLVTASPTGGTLTFTGGSGVIGNIFDPAGLSGVHSIQVDYTAAGCVTSDVIEVTVLGATDAACIGGNCNTVEIVPNTLPATCSNSDGGVTFVVNPPTPAINNTGVTFDIYGPKTITNHTNNTFAGLPVGQYTYSIQYGDPSCVKTGSFSIDRSGTVGEIAISDPIAPSCEGGVPGSAIIDVPGHTGEIFEWSTDGATFTKFEAGKRVSPIPAGEVIVSVRRNSTDVCTSDKAFTMSGSEPLAYTASIRPVDCGQGRNSGAISVTIHDTGNFRVALSTDQSPPDEFAYEQYTNPGHDFNGLKGGRYYVFIKKVGEECVVRTGAKDVPGYPGVSFELQPHCNGDQLSLSLMNLTGSKTPGAPNLQIMVFNSVTSQGFDTLTLSPESLGTGVVYYSYDQHEFLRKPGEYSIRASQWQEAVGPPCLADTTVKFVVPPSLSAEALKESASYPERATGSFTVGVNPAGAWPYDVRVTLDSAASLALPAFETSFEPAELNGELRPEKRYSQLPPGRYSVEVRDSLGCVIEFPARVPLDTKLFIPTVFTPNGDDYNEVFYIRNLPTESSKNELIITNRWGKQIFASDNYQNNWNGDDVADGVYFYRLRIDGGDVHTGWVEIMRGRKP